MSLTRPQTPPCVSPPCGLPNPTARIPLIFSLAAVLALSALAPAGAGILFPHDYGNGEILTFSGGTPGNSYELRVAQPAGDIVKASEAHLDVSFVDHGRVKIQPRNVAPEVYREFYGAGGGVQALAAVYVAGTDTIVDGTLVIDTTYDPSPLFPDADFVGNQRWTTGVETIAGETGIFSFAWKADHGGGKNWRLGNPASHLGVRCEILSDFVAVLEHAATDSGLASLVNAQTDAVGTSGQVSIRFNAPAYKLGGDNDYTVRIHNQQDPYGIGGEGQPTGCSGSALDVRFTVRQGDQVLTGAYEDGELRLVNGATPNEGRLEIYYEGQWGTVCDDYWTDADADVACRQLGYEQGSVPDGGRFLQSHFGPADEGAPIWLDNLLCDGDESSLMDCPRASQPGGTDPGHHNCSLRHLEDVGVRCETSELAAFSVADDSANEGGTLYFRIHLSRARESATRVDYATVDGTATAGADYVPATGTLVFNAGQRTKHVEVTVLDDTHDEGSETLTLVLSNPMEARIEDSEATGTIVNSDPLPKAWMARFGRTVAGHLVDALQARLETPPDSYVRLGGYRLDGAAGVEGDGPGSAWTTRLAPLGKTGPPASAERQAATRRTLSGSAFHLVSNAGTPGDSPRLTAWGRAAASGFDGQSDGVSTDGRVATAMVGVDGAWKRWVTGVALAHSEGDGSFGSASLPGGDIGGRLTSVHPYAAYRLSDRAWIWGMGGFGEGVLALKPDRSAGLETGIGMTMAAAGVRSALLAPARGPHLNLETDGLWVRTTSEAVPGLAATSAIVSRARLGLESAYAVPLHSGSALTPKLGIGLRHDAGDAETGWGVEVGGGLAWAPATPGWSVELEARSLVGHQVGGFRDWSLSSQVRYDRSPASEHGLWASLRSSLGTAAWSGADALLAQDTLAGLTAGHEPNSGQLTAEAAYGSPILGGRFTGTPWVAAAILEHQRTYKVGYRVSPGNRSASGIRVNVEGLQRRTLDGKAERAIHMRLAARW